MADPRLKGHEVSAGRDSRRHAWQYTSAAVAALVRGVARRRRLHGESRARRMHVGCAVGQQHRDGARDCARKCQYQLWPRPRHARSLDQGGQRAAGVVSVSVPSPRAAPASSEHTLLRRRAAAGAASRR
jgi:hypothetical protein